MTNVRPPARFLADALGLDLLNSRSTPGGRETEWLENGNDFLVWLENAEVLTAESANKYRDAILADDLDAVAARARGLREWFRMFVDKHMGGSLTEDAEHELGPLNVLLAESCTYYHVGATKGGHVDGESSMGQTVPVFCKVLRSRWQGANSLLFPLGEAIADFVTSADFSRIKRCEGPACGNVFLDTTRGQSRRWCSMARCGNRAKQALHRERRRRARGEREGGGDRR
jgi:predicted RNA-binding Zn ribbon-like protein